jgi:hypothetical protein
VVFSGCHLLDGGIYILAAAEGKDRFFSDPVFIFGFLEI